ncbi:DUF485 domain-containing protein [Metabacillus indicus]|uniref:DUF485 domain-containing protein n=1 Tax=Metabacillus indicus TaxID=246786 RepID=UPI003CFA1B11
MNDGKKQVKAVPSAVDYTKIVQSESFQKLLQAKRSFILPMTLFFLAFYFTLPVLTAYSDVLNQPAAGPVSWAWVFAFAQFIMTWALCMMYSRKARKFDEIVETIKSESTR